MIDAIENGKVSKSLLISRREELVELKNVDRLSCVCVEHHDSIVIQNNKYESNSSHMFNLCSKESVIL